MRSQLSYSMTLLRWALGLGFLAVFPFVLHDLRADEDWKGALCVLLAGVGAIGSEIYLRTTRKTLTLRNGTVEVTRRGVSLGSFSASYVQYRGWRSRTRVLAKFMLFPLLAIGVGFGLYSTGKVLNGLVSIFFGLVLIAALIYDFTMLWEVIVPKPKAGFQTVTMSRPGGVDPISTSFAIEKQVILLRKPDVRTLLGFWPLGKMGGRETSGNDGMIM